MLTAAIYIFFGSSMQLCVGPVALVSLLTAQLINKYNIDYVNDPNTAVEFAGEAALAVGTILSIMSILNLGELIRFISHPVMSGFTTGAALIIGLNQIKSAFGFTVSVPQQGQPGYDYNYQVMSWFTSRWDLHYHFTAAQIKKKPSLGLQDGRSYQNHYAIRIFFGLYIPLLFIVILKNYFKPTPERRKSWVFHAWTIFANLMPFVAVIIGAHVAWKIKHDDGYNNPRISHDWFAKKLSIVGQVKSGLSFTGMPSLRWDFGTLLGDVVETALIAYMESYGVAQRCAKQNNEFHLLNANQEMFAISCANFLASVSHGYPVAGSFSRSSLNHLAGAKTPFSKVVNMFVVVIALGSLTRTFQYIPNAALAAIIWIAVFQLVSFSDMWDAWKHSKKDFFVMFATCVFVFILNTGVGLAIGIGISVLVHLLETSFSPINAPQVIETEEETVNEIKYIRLKADLTFLTIGRTQDIVNAAIYVPPKAPDSENSTWNDQVFFKISNAFDQFFQPKLIRGTSVLPKVVAIDFAATSVIDLDAIHAVDDFSRAARSRGVAFFILNVHPTIAKTLVKFGYVNDDLTYFIDPIVAQRYHLLGGDIIPIVARLVTILDKEKEKEEQYAVVATNEDESKKDVDAQENI